MIQMGMLIVESLERFQIGSGQITRVPTQGALCVKENLVRLYHLSLVHHVHCLGKAYFRAHDELDSVRLCVRLYVVSLLNCLTCDRDIWFVG